jgi:hypothetical protein
MEFSGVTMTGGYSVLTGAAPVVPTDTYWANVSFLSETTSTDAQTNNTFLDGSSIAATVSNAGAASASLTQGSYSPYPANNTTSYSAATNGGSGFFPGTAAYLSVPANAAYQIGTGDFTVEFWVNFNSVSGAIIPFMQSCPLGSGTGNNWWMGYIPGTGLVFNCHGGGGLATSIAWTPTTGTWYYVTASRASGTLRLYINGVQGTLVVSQGNPAQTLNQNGYVVGAITTPYYFNGYMSDVRVVTGTALYTGSTLTVPTAPLTAVSGTTLLLNYTNAGIYDARANSVLISAGSAQASTTQAKWSPTSLKLSGGTDALTMPSSSNFNFGSGDFTIEAWIYISSYVSSSAVISKGAFGPFLIFIGSSSEIAFYSSTNGSSWAVADLRFATAPATNTWHYIAVTRSGTTVRTFFNGTLANSTTLTGAVVSNATDISVGRYSSSFNGYIQDLRLTNGVARYTATFTPPTAALPTSA